MKSSVINDSSKAMAVKRRQACSQTVLHLWDAIAYIRQQKQIPNFERLSAYMNRVYNLSPSDLERQLKFAVHDELIHVKKSVGCKGSKVGFEQDGYRIPEEMEEKDGHDWYCFECHRGGEVILCTTCHRVYHEVCINEDSKSTKFVCSTCKNAEKYALNVKKSELNTLLGFTCVRLKEKTRELHRIPHPDDEKWRFNFMIYEPMDLIAMEEKMKSNEYTKLYDFYTDALQIVHNVVVYFGLQSRIADMARQMLGDCEYDLKEIMQCSNCYKMSNTKADSSWFCQPCNPPHELVYAKVKRFPYWPAKVIKKEDNIYDVRFFGAFHQRALIHQDYIKPVSTPYKKIGISYTSSFARAYKELLRHQKLVEAAAKNPPAADTQQSDQNNEEENKNKTETVNDTDKKDKPETVNNTSKKNKTVAVNDLRRKRSRSETMNNTNKTTESVNTRKRNRIEGVNNTGQKGEAKTSTTSSDAMKLKTTLLRKRKSAPTPLTKPPSAKKTATVPVKKNKKFYQESPTSSSPKNAATEEVLIPEDHNLVSSSSQDTSVFHVSIGVQTPKQFSLPEEEPPEKNNNDSNEKTEKQNCNCSEKYEKLLKDLQSRLEAEHKEDKKKSLKEYSDKLQKEIEAEKQKNLSLGLEKLQQEHKEAQAKAIEQLKQAHTEEMCKMIERRNIELSETKKKQWCYNCETEAIYHCCWNTSYCTVECQQVHWHKEHKRTCRRKR